MAGPVARLPTPPRGWSWERTLLVVGVVLAAGLVAQMAILSALSPRWAYAMAAHIVAEVFTGREGGIPVGLNAGAPTWLVFETSVVQDLAAVCLTFPLVLWAIHRYHDRDNRPMRLVRRVEAAAARHQAYVRRWGPLGLFGFMLIPFLVNGPLVGAVLGRLAGLRTPNLIMPIVAASVVAAAAWTFFYDRMLSLAESADARFGDWITYGIVVVLVALGIAGWLSDRRRLREGRAASEEE